MAGTPATLPSYALDSASLNRHQQRLDDSPDLEKSLKFGYLEAKWSSFVNETVKDLGPEGIFDYLIVDEAQNLCNEVFLTLMNKLLKSGLTEGRFTMFGDFENQNILFYSDIEDERDGRDNLNDFIKGCDKSSDLPERRELKTNCRNTHQIVTKTSELTELGSLPLSGVYGPDVQIEFFSGKEWKEQLDCLVRDLKEREFQSRQIILLASDDKFNMDMDSCGGWKLFNIREASSNGLRYSNIYDRRLLGRSPPFSRRHLLGCYRRRHGPV